MFTFNSGIPAAGNNPSNDQPIMQTNNVSNANIWDVDHVGFNQNNGGRHLKVTFNSKNAPGAQTDPVSTIYTGSGTASSVSQLLYRNQNGIFQINPIRAWAFCSPSGITASQSVNVSSVARKGGFPAGVFTVTLTSNAVSSSNFAVLVSMQSTATTGTLRAMFSQYVIDSMSSGVFDLYFQDIASNNRDPTNFSFQVLQI